MSIDLDEIRKVKQMMKDFLYTVHGYGVGQIDFDSVKKEKDKMKIQGSFKIMGKESEFIAEFDNEGRLLSYERVKGESKS